MKVEIDVWAAFSGLGVPGEDKMCRVGNEGREGEGKREKGIKEREGKGKRDVKKEKWREKCEIANAWLQWLENSPGKRQPASASWPHNLRVTPHQGASVLTLSPWTTLRSIAHPGTLQLQLPLTLLHVGRDILILIPGAGEKKGKNSGSTMA